MRKLINYIFVLFLLFLSLPCRANDKQSRCEELFKKAEKERVDMNYAKAMEYLMESKMLAEQNGWLDMKMQSITRIGYIYVNIMDYDMAMSSFIESYDIAVKSSNKSGELIALNNIALACHESDKKEEAGKYLEKAYKIALDLNDSLRIIQVANNLALLFSEMKNIPLAEKYLNIAFNTLNLSIEDLELIHLRFTEIKILYSKEDYDRAEQLILILFEQLKTLQYNDKKTQTKGFVNIIPGFLVQLSKIYKGKNNLDKAISSAKEVLNYNPSLKEEIEAYEELAILFRKEHSFDLALQYMDSMVMKKDSLHKIINSKNLENSRIKFDMLNLEKELVENRAKQKADRILFATVSISILVLLIVLVLVFRLKAEKNKQQKILELEKEKNEKLLLEQQLKEKEIQAFLEQERLTNKIENKDKQLIAEALFHSNRDKLIKELIQVFSEDSLMSKPPVLEDIIKKLEQQLKDSADVNIFQLQLEQTNPSLLSLLKEQYPDLSTDDIHLLSYIYVERGEIKKIARLMNISVDACQKRKERLSIKMGIKTADFYSHLLNIMRTSISKELFG
jgi:tetratricopeptide (TPR) repeat protein